VFIQELFNFTLLNHDCTAERSRHGIHKQEYGRMTTAMEYYKDSDETDEEEDDQTEPKFTPTSTPGVPRWGRLMCQTNRGTHGHTPDERSDEDDDKMTPNPLASEGVSKWGQFTGDTPGKRQNVAPHIKKGLDCIQHFHVVFCTCYHSAGGQDQQLLPHLTMDLLHYLTLLKLKCFCFWRLLFKWDMTYTTAW
jgi:hypothetical protein